MYNTKEVQGNIHITFEGVIGKFEMSQFQGTVVTYLKKTKKGFNVLVDMSKMMPLDPDAEEVLVKVQKLFKAMGMNRAAVICPSDEIKAQLETIAKASGNDNERYFTDRLMGEGWVR